MTIIRNDLVLKGILILAIICLLGQLIAQPYTIRGIVKDDRGELVEFVNVFANRYSIQSTFTDIDGKFEITSDNSISTLSFIHFGYKEKVVEISTPVLESLQIIIQELPDNHLPNRNDNESDPAWPIIDKVIANERFHNPEKQGSSFSYSTYNRTIVDLFEVKHHKYPDKYKDRVEKDSLFIKHHRIHGHQHVEVMETMTKRTFEYPNKNHEKVEGLKVTGLDDQNIVPLSSNVHPISIYGNYFEFLGIRYASPLGKNSHQKYNFYKKGTLYKGQDTVHVIDFEPRRLRNMTGLEGTLYINSNKYAAENIVVRPVDKGLIDFKISQKFEMVDNKEWFPKQINYVYLLEKFPKPYLGTIYDKKTYIKDINLNPDFGRKDHRVELVLCEHYATNQDEEFWEEHRIDPLSNKQKITYLRVDTLRHKSTASIVIKRLLAFYKSRLAYRVPGFVLGNVFRLNRFEAVRLGLSARTSEEVSRRFEFNGYSAYGIRDEDWKYGGGVALFLNKKHDAKIEYHHFSDIIEPGQINYLDKEPDFFRKIFTNRMDDYESNQVHLSFRTPGYHLFEFGLNEYTKRPSYDYQYKIGQDVNGDILTDEVDITEVSFRTRYAINERVSNTLGEVVRLGSFYPIIYLNYTRGINGLFSGKYDYQKVSTSIDYKVHVGHIGTSEITIEGGIMDSDVPYPTLFNGSGGNLGTSSIIIQDAFQTMGIYEFVSSRFLNLYYSHDFGPLIFGHSKLKPDFVIYHHMGWGELDDKILHRSTETVFQSYNKGFFESGLGINNLLKFKLFGVLYGRLGMGFFYRYGPHENPGGFGENFAYRLTYSIKGL